MLCTNCGAEIADGAKFCDACGAQTAAEQASIRAEKARNTDEHTDKSLSGSIWITVGMAVFSLVIVIIFGFDSGEGMVASITAIVFSVLVCAVKWYFEIKNQRKWKREAEEKARGGDWHVM